MQRQEPNVYKITIPNNSDQLIKQLSYRLDSIFNDKQEILENIYNFYQKYNNHNYKQKFKDSEFLLNIQNKELWNKAMEHYMVKDKKLSIAQFIALIKNMAIAF